MSTLAGMKTCAADRAPASTPGVGPERHDRRLGWRSVAGGL